MAHFSTPPTIIIFISDDTLTFGTNANKLYIYFKYATYSLLAVVLLIKFGIRTVVPQSILYLFVIIIAVFLTALANYDLRGGYGYQVLVLILAFLVAHFLNFKQFSAIFSKYIFVLSVISIFVFHVVSSFSWILELFPVYENTAGVNFTNLYISGVFHGIAETRNTGIFREPGVFMIYILLGMIFQLFYTDRLNVKYILFYFIAIITTFSTAAYIILLVIFIGYLLKNTTG